jgi:hypothetical protein
MLTLRLRRYSRMGSATASSSTPDASISRSALIVLTYWTMTSVVAAPDIRALSDHDPEADSITGLVCMAIHTCQGYDLTRSRIVHYISPACSRRLLMAARS